MDLFNSPNGDGSAKRVIGSIIIAWCLLMASFYFGHVVDGGRESRSIENILITFMGVGATMIVGGVLDGLFNKKNKDKNEIKRKINQEN